MRQQSLHFIGGSFNRLSIPRSPRRFPPKALLSAVPNPPPLSNSGALSASEYHNGGKDSFSDAKKNHVRRGSRDDADERVAPEKLKRNRYRSGQIRSESAPLQRRVGIDD